MKNTLIVYSVLMLLLPSITSAAGSPLDAVQSHVSNVLAVLRTPSSDGEGATEDEKREKLRVIAESMFDFVTLSKWSLGKNWRKLTKEQQQEFVALYKKILEKAYMDKIMAYTDQKVLFKKNVMFTDNKAEVQTVIQTSSTEIPINYRVMRTHGKWLVYDVNIEGVSLVKNYRSQFNSILSKKSPEDLLQMLRDKAADS